MGKPKIIFSDIDGTLLNDARVLSETTIKEFKRVKTEIPIVLISSRMPKAMTHLQKMAEINHFPIIAYNGGLILIDEKEAFTLEIEVSIIESMMQFNTKEKVHFSLYNTNDWYVPKMDYWAMREQNNTKVTPTILSNKEVVSHWKSQKKGAHKIMCMGNVDDIDELYSFLKEHFNNQLHLYRSKSTYIEIAPSAVSKKTAIEFLLKNKYSEINTSEVAAFGDNYNDIDMLKAVGYSVAVANAKKEVKAASKYITEHTGAEDGVAHFIKKHIPVI